MVLYFYKKKSKYLFFFIDTYLDKIKLTYLFIKSDRNLTGQCIVTRYKDK